MFSRIVEIRSIRDQKARLSERERQLSMPMLEDFSVINRIREYFHQKYGMGHSRKSASHIRRKFTFVVVALYSPTVLADGRMPKGIRDKLTSALKLNSPSSVSHMCAEMWLWYNQYGDYNKEINEAFSYVVGRLRVDGYLK